MEVSSKYGYTDKKKLKMNGLAESSHKSDNNYNGHETNESSDSVSSGEDNHMHSRREMSSGTSNTSRSSSRDGMSGQSGCLNQDGQRRRSSEDGMLVANGMSQGAMSAQGELQLQQDGSGRVQSRKQRTFTPEVSKDTTYWEKRRKNNEAARRSREKRRQYDMARERSVQDITTLNKYLIRQLCILKRKLGIPVNENVEGSNEDSEQIERDCRALMAALLAETDSVNTSGSSGNLAVNIALHRTSPIPAITAANASFSDMPMQNSMNGERQNLYNLSPADSVTSSYSMKSFKSESAHQPPASRLKFEIVPLGLIKQEPHDEFSNTAFANSNATSRSIDNFTNASEIFENTTSGVNMVRDTGDLLINGRRSFSTSPSSWYPVPMDHSVAGVVVGHHGQLPNGINLTNHANASTPSPTSSSSSINNFSMSNGHSIPQLPVQQQEENEPLQLTVNKRARLDSDNSSEVPDPAEDLQWNCNSRNRLSSPTANSNSHRSAHSLPLKLRHKASLPDHTIALTHSLTPTTMISSTAFGNSSMANLNHPQTNGLSHLSDVALSQNGPLPLLKRDANGQVLHQRNSQCKENDNTCISSNNSVMDNEKRSPSVEDLNAMNPSADHEAAELQLLDSDSSQISIERLKDPRYVERRRRNNEAARKCRENRKTLHQMREAQTSFYEMQNSHLKVKVAQQREELGRLQLLLKKKQETGTIPSLSNSKNNDKNSDEDEADVKNTKKNM